MSRHRAGPASPLAAPRAEAVPPPRRLTSRLNSWLGPLALLGLSSCSGAVSGIPADPERGAPPVLHRLTRTEYQNSVLALFAAAGPGLKLPTDLEADTALHGYTTVAGSELTVSPRAAEQIEAAALDLAHQIFADPARRDKLVGCTPAAERTPATLAGDACARKLVTALGLHAFRRPLTDDEINEHLALAQAVAQGFGSMWSGLEYAVVAMLESPHFLFRVERGEPEPAVWPVPAGRLRYTSWEMASRLSYTLWSGPPDDELLAAAARDELTGDEGVRREALRMLAHPAAQAGIGRFFAEYLKLDRLRTANKDKQKFPQLTDALLAAMRGEIERDAAALLSPEADLRDLLTAGSTFVNPVLAGFYGLDVKDQAPDEWRRVELPADGPRGGLLTTAGFLAINAHETLTSPTLRGRFIREVLLCQDIPPPPPGVVTSLKPPETGEKTTLRQRLEQHRQDPVCRGCHERMDPLGLSLENFDAIGAFRDKEDGLPIDASSVLDGSAFAGGRELGRLLHDHPRLPECVARQLYRFAAGHLEVEGEQAQIARLGESLARGGFRLRQLIVTLLLSDGFRFADPHAPVAAPAPAPMTDTPTMTLATGRPAAMATTHAEGL